MVTRRCPHCLTLHDMATKAPIKADAVGDYVPPKDSVGICWTCGSVFVMHYDGSTRPLFPHESEAVMTDPVVQRALADRALIKGGEAQG